MKNAKRVISFILTVVMVAALAVSAFATEYYPKYTGNSPSLVDALKSVGAPSSYDARESIANANGITNYTGSAEQNKQLIGLLRDGRLVKPGSQNSGSSGSSVPSLRPETVHSLPLHRSGNQLMEVVVDNAPLRTDCYKRADVVARCAQGAVLEVTGSCVNKYDNTWLCVEWNGETCYIYSGNMAKHTHSYEHIKLDGVDYAVCNCGDVIVDAPNKAKQDQGIEMCNTVALALPATLSAADGPFPFGDIIAAGILVVGVVETYSNTKAKLSLDELASVISDEAFLSYLDQRKENVCDETSFRRVARVNGTLKYIDNQCLNRFEAYIYVALLGGDVYTPTEAAATQLVLLYGGGILERDKDKETYFYHFHLGVHRTLKGHVFFGTNDLGETPT